MEILALLLEIKENFPKEFIYITFNNDKKEILASELDEIEEEINRSKWLNFTKNLDSINIVDNIRIMIEINPNNQREIYHWLNSKDINLYINVLKDNNPALIHYKTLVKKLINIIGLRSYTQYLYEYRITDSLWISDLIPESLNEECVCYTELLKGISVNIYTDKSNIFLNIQNKNSKKMDWDELYYSLILANISVDLKSALFDSETEEIYDIYPIEQRFYLNPVNYKPFNWLDETTNIKNLTNNFSDIDSNLKKVNIYRLYLVIPYHE